jgi:hypothetical protein
MSEQKTQKVLIIYYEPGHLYKGKETIEAHELAREYLSAMTNPNGEKKFALPISWKAKVLDVPINEEEVAENE